MIKLIIHLIADYNSGFQGDELLHIATGNHPAFGYMEFPPVIGWLAWIQDQFGSTSVFVHHIFNHIATLFILILIGLTTVELGGRSRAVFLVMLCVLAAPAFDRGQQLFQPVVFSQLFWVLSFYLLVKFVKAPNNRSLFYLTLALGFGFLTKYDIVFFMAGLSSLFFFKRIQAMLLSNQVWKYIVLFLLLTGPNLWWQYQHGFPVFQMFSRLYETQLDKLTPGKVIGGLVLGLNPVTLLIWPAGLIFMFNTTDKETYRPLAISIVLCILCLAISKSKDYYFYSAFIFLMIFGSIWFEQKILASKRWILYPVFLLFLLTGLFLMPWGMMVLPLHDFISDYKIKKENNRYQIHYEEYYSAEKWKNTLTALQAVYDSLPGQERNTCLIWGKHYRQAGAVDLFGRKYGLPGAFSYHGSFYLWAPQGQMPETVIGFTNDEASIAFFKCYFSSVVAVKKLYNPYADFDKDVYQTIYICKKPKQNFDELRTLFKKRVFE